MQKFYDSKFQFLSETFKLPNASDQNCLKMEQEILTDQKGMVGYICNLSTGQVEAGGLPKFQGPPDYIMSSRLVQAAK